MKTLMFALLFLLAGCTTTGDLTASQLRTIETGCASASAALKVLTVANDAGKLSAETPRQVLSAAGTIAPICGADEPPTLTSLQMQAFTHAVALLGAHAQTEN
jgi:hypothetical protein